MKDKEGIGLLEMEWGVLPTNLHDAMLQDDIRRIMVNARSERLLDDKKSFWYRLLNQRCLIPVSGRMSTVRLVTGKRKLLITLSRKVVISFTSLVFIHGMETVDTDGLVEKVGSIGMLARAANDVTANIHNDGPNKCRYFYKKIWKSYGFQMNYQKMICMPYFI